MLYIVSDEAQKEKKKKSLNNDNYMHNLNIYKLKKK